MSSGARTRFQDIEYALDRALRLSDRPHDWVTREARDAMLRYFAAEPGFANQMIRSAVFLAVTEDAPVLDREFVDRAAVLNPPLQGMEGRLVPPLRRVLRASVVIVGVGVALIWPSGRVLPDAVRSFGRLANPLGEHRVVRAAATAPVAKNAESPPLLPPIPEVIVRDPALPPHTASIDTITKESGGPFVVISIPERVNDATSFATAQRMVRHIHAAGLPGEIQHDAVEPPRTVSVRYYHWQDYDLAKQASEALHLAIEPRLYRVHGKLGRGSRVVEIVLPRQLRD